MKTRPIRIISAALVLTFAALSLALFMPQRALADPQEGPDPDQFKESGTYGNSYPGVDRKVDYVVSRDGFTDITTSRLKIYLPNQTGSIRVYDHHLCLALGAGSGVRNYDSTYDTSSGTVTSYRAYGVGGGSDQTQYGYWTNMSNCQNAYLTFNLSGADLDPNTGMYLYAFTATALANGKFSNGFHLTVSAGGIISQDSTNAAQSFGMMQTYPVPGGDNPQQSDPPNPYKNYSSWFLRFAPDCGVTSQTANDYVEIYDDDNNLNLDIQPRRFSITMYERQRDGTFIRKLDPTSIQFPDGYGGSANADIANYYYVYTTANKKRIRIYYNFNRDLIYEFVIRNVYYDNTLQLKLPYDNVYYYQECQIPSAKLKAGMSANVTKASPGDNITFTPSISATNFRNSMTVNCTVRRTIAPSGGSPADVGAQPCVTTGGSSNITISGNGTVTLRGNTYNIPTNMAPGSTICDTITITNPTDDKYFNGAGDKTAQSCVKVIGRPYLQVLGNDVWAGGRFDFTNNQCGGAPTPRLSSISSWVAGGAGAMGRYGVMALGAITGFGSGGQPGNTGLDFANTPSLGNLGAQTRCMPNYYSRIGTAGAAWPGIGGLTANMGKKTYFVNGNVTIGGGTIPEGTQVALVVNGTATITGDINYASAASGANMPSFWLVANGNVNVQENVTKISGLYVAEGTSVSQGTFQTCVRSGQSVTYNPMTTTGCSSTLTVNGAVIADRSFWQRTEGTAVTGQPAAEIVDFNTGLYLTSPVQSTINVETQDSKELPPIY